MPTLKVIGSGSKGNCYLLETSKETLILDLGCKWGEVKNVLGNTLKKVTAAIVTHIHKDHSRYVKDAVSDAVPVYSCKEVADEYKGVKSLEVKKWYRIGEFTIMPLIVPHNVENFSYLIKHNEFGMIVFITDCTTFPYRIKGINHWLIEANYSEDIQIDNLCKGYDIQSRNEYHMEINETISVLRRNCDSDVQSITLCHVSSGQGNSKLFRDMIQQEFPLVGVNVAKAGGEIELNKDDF